MGISRRDLLKLCGASAAMAGLGTGFSTPVLASGTGAAPSTGDEGYGVLIDTTRCVGCKQCQFACKQANNLPTDDHPVALSPTTLTIVELRNISAEAQKPIIKPVKKQCMHCLNAACISVCPVGALYRTEKGCVAYDADKCIGCRYCMTACPFGVPKYDWNSPNLKISKCVAGCMEDGKRDQPACVQACPNQALHYGQREELLAVAKGRIRENPDKYVDHIYGEKEIGGTSRIYLSGTPFEQLGFRTDLPNVKLPELTWNAQSKIPYVIVGAASVLSGVGWWTHRGESE
jgi:formate dehydrogenase iron-sulfur subunit